MENTSQSDVELRRLHAGHGRDLALHARQVVGHGDEAAHVGAALGVDGGGEVGAGKALQVLLDALAQAGAGGRRAGRPQPQQIEQRQHRRQRRADAQQGAVAPAGVVGAARVGHAVGLGGDARLRQVLAGQVQLELPAVQVLELAELALVAFLEVVLALEAQCQRVPVHLAHRVVVGAQGRQVVEELAVRVGRVEQLRLQRRGAVRARVARQDLVDPGHHGEGRELDLRGGRARGVGLVAGRLEQAARLALGLGMRQCGRAGRDRRVQREAERDEGGEAVVQAGHGNGRSAKGCEGCLAPASAQMAHAHVPGSFE
jgi:hypothetical protein